MFLNGFVWSIVFKFQPSDAGVALTAHVILALHNCDSHVEGTTKTRVVEAIQRGQKSVLNMIMSLGGFESTMNFRDFQSVLADI